jgi:alkaline phosphatase D
MPSKSNRVTRRELLNATLGAGVAAYWPSLIRAATPRFAAYPFALGISSGFPTDRSIVLHTRLATEPLAPDGFAGMPPEDVPLSWELARDDRFRRRVASGEILAQASLGHSARVVVSGLDPAHDYFYRFIAGGEVSATGRTRTLPSPDRMPREFRLVLANCQHFEHGQWAAYRHIAASPPELLVHLGDYIYEGASTLNRVRAHAGGECLGLLDYRRRYAQYRSDPALQAAHAAAPWITTWDDHEVANDYSGIHSGRAQDPQLFLARRTAAYQAYFENLPLPPSAAPIDGVVALYTSRRIGHLANLFMLDQRQYRSAQACPLPGRAGGNRIAEDCADLRDESRTMLGTEQEIWLEGGVSRAKDGRWNLLAQGTLVSYMDEMPGQGRQFGGDSWNGYPAARRHLLDMLQRRQVRNPVIFTGDMHAFMAGNIGTVPGDPRSTPLATEIVATSVSSDPRPQPQLAEWARENPNLMLVDGSHRGYVALRLSPARLQADLMAVENRDDSASSQRILHSLVVESGRPELQRA